MTAIVVVAFLFVCYYNFSKRKKKEKDDFPPFKWVKSFRSAIFHHFYWDPPPNFCLTKHTHGYFFIWRVAFMHVCGGGGGFSFWIFKKMKKKVVVEIVEGELRETVRAEGKEKRVRQMPFNDWKIEKLLSRNVAPECSSSWSNFSVIKYIHK